MKRIRGSDSQASDMSKEQSRDSTLNNALEKTVSAEHFSAEALRRELERTDVDATPCATPQSFLLKTETESTPLGSDETTGLSGFGDTTGVPPKLIADSENAGPRFRIIDEVGTGGTSRVYAVQDRSLDRTVALKLLRGKGALKPGVEQRFIHEARVTAMLEHPNVMPVHDIGMTENGRVFFTMKNITGVSLGDAIRAEKAGDSVPEEFGTFNGKIGIFLKICDALSFAHDRSFVHQDVKPDNVMLGEYGEVLLLDWGCALTAAEATGAEEHPVYGTPAYMSPEQARRESVDERSDIYCLGATLFHALTRRHPTWDTNPEGFWEKKRSGVVDELTDDERRRVPKALRAIVGKALQADPRHRYQTVAALRRDLERFQAGQAVLAYRESPLEAFLRWYRRHQRTFWWTSAACVLILGTGGMLFREKLKEMLTWKLVFSEDFSGTTTADLPTGWKAVALPQWYRAVPDTLGTSSGTWTVARGALVGAPEGPGCFDIAYSRAIHGDLRVEWDATSLRGGRDLNCFIGGEDRRSGYTFHVAGFGANTHVDMTKGATDTRLDRVRLPAVVREGRTYHFRMEREGYNVRFFMDGARLIDYVDVDILSGVSHQTFGFDITEGAQVRIDNIRVYHHPLPRKVSPLVAPRQFEDEGQYRNALVRYRDLRRAYPGTDIAARAMFRGARCLQLMDSAAAALESYAAFESAFPRHSLVPLSAFQRSQILSARGKVRAADSIYAFLARRYRGHPVTRSALLALTDRAVAELEAHNASFGSDSATDAAMLSWCDSAATHMQRWCAALGSSTADNQFVDRCAAFLLSDAVGMPLDSVAARFPAQRSALTKALTGRLNIGRLIADFPDARNEIADCLVQAGRYREVLQGYDDCEAQAAQALLRIGELQDVLRRYPASRPQCASALLGLGRVREVAEQYRDVPDSCAKALFLLGRHEECLDRFPRTYFARLAALTTRLYDGYLDIPSVNLHARVVFVNNMLHRPRLTLDMLARNKTRMAQYTYSWELYKASYEAGLVREALKGDELYAQDRWLFAMLNLDSGAYLMRRLPWSTFVRFKVLRNRGLYDSCVSFRPQNTLETIETMRLAGRNADILRRFSDYPRFCAQALLRLGRYEEILTDYPDQRDVCAEALCRLGRYAAVTRRYPEQRSVCFKAVALSAGEDSAFALYPEQRALYAQRLLQVERHTKLIESLPERTTEIAVALTRLERRTDVPLDTGIFRVGRLGRHEVLSIWAMHDWNRGRRARARKHLAARPPVYQRVDKNEISGEDHLRFAQHLLVPLLKAFDGDTGALQRAADSIARHCRYRYAQQLFYESAYLARRIGDSTFLTQPHGDSVEVRLKLYRALRDDVRGNDTRARVSYAQLLATPFPEGLLYSHTLRELLRWRLEELGHTLPVGNPPSFESPDTLVRRDHHG